MISSSRLPQSGVGARRLHGRINSRAILESDQLLSSWIETMETACPHAALRAAVESMETACPHAALRAIT